MTGVPASNEAAPYYFTYIDKIRNPNITSELETQLVESRSFWRGISEEKSLHRYAPEKWSIREVLSHINDTERVFAYRALWFARGFEAALPSFDQEMGVRGAHADDRPCASHVEEFEAVRMSTLTLFSNLPAEAWSRSGIASGNPVTVKALAYIVAGHLAHHRQILESRYL